MKSFLAVMLATADGSNSNHRVRRATEFRLANSKIIPKSMPSFSPMRDNVITMVAMGLKSAGMNKATLRATIDGIFTHGCHCGWSYNRYELSDKSGKGADQLDQACLDFEHCSECVKMDGCLLHQGSFAPLVNGTDFSCNHLDENSCEYNKCLCTTSMASKVLDSFTSVTFEKLTFTEFMDECTAEVDANINTQMNLGLDSIFGSQRGLGVQKTRQCCGSYPERKAFTYTGPISGMACCSGETLFDQKHNHCCGDGRTAKIGDVCW